MKYRKESFDEICELLYHSFGLYYENHGLHIAEFISDAGFSMFRITHIPNTGDILFSFHVGLPPSEAVEIFKFVSQQYTLVELSSEYFIDEEGQTYVGQEAYIEHDKFLKKAYAANSDMEEEIKIDDEVSIIIQNPIYDASHPKAKENFKYFREFQKERRSL
jgi:hypothetical protein